MYMTDRQVAARYAVTRTTVWKWRKTDPSFPEPVQLSPGCTRWRLEDIEAWEKSKTNGAAA